MRGVDDAGEGGGGVPRRENTPGATRDTHPWVMDPQKLSPPLTEVVGAHTAHLTRRSNRAEPRSSALSSCATVVHLGNSSHTVEESQQRRRLEYAAAAATAVPAVRRPIAIRAGAEVAGAAISDTAVAATTAATTAATQTSPRPWWSAAAEAILGAVGCAAPGCAPAATPNPAQ